MTDGDFTDLIGEIFRTCKRLSELTGRPVSPDGHLVGSLGEVFAASQLGLSLMPPSNGGYDAIDGEGRKVEIKTTTGSAIALASKGTQATRLVVVKFDESGQGAVLYDGPASPVWDAAGPAQANGQRRISLHRLKTIAG